MEIAAKFTNPEMILIMGLIMGIIFGIIVGLVVTAITKKPNPDLEA